MKKVYIKPEIKTETLEFGVFGCYLFSSDNPGNNGGGHAYGNGFWNNPFKIGNHGTDHDHGWGNDYRKNP